MGYYTREQQELIIETYKLIVDDCKSLEELMWQPIDWKIACMSPEEMSDDLKKDFHEYYNKKAQALKDAGKIDRFFSRMDEASEKLGIY